LASHQLSHRLQDCCHSAALPKRLCSVIPGFFSQSTQSWQSHSSFFFRPLCSIWPLLLLL
jgi:hypothetical protein